YAFQLYPMLWSSSPHNYAIETLATGGWPRLALLLVVGLTSVWRGLNSDRWPWAVAAIALGTTLMFDVTADYPRVTTMLFLLLGGSYYGRQEADAPAKDPVSGAAKQIGRALGLLASAVLLAVALWWYLPCS